MQHFEAERSACIWIRHGWIAAQKLPIHYYYTDRGEGWTDETYPSNIAKSSQLCWSHKYKMLDISKLVCCRLETQ